MSVTNPYSSDNRRYTSAQDEPAADLPQSSPGNPPESCITSIGRTTQATPHACSNMPQHFLMPADCSGAAVICAAPPLYSYERLPGLHGASQLSSCAVLVRGPAQAQGHRYLQKSGSRYQSLLCYGTPGRPRASSVPSMIP